MVQLDKYLNHDFPLNTFVLWSKNWYKFYNHNLGNKKELVEELVWVLFRDGYMPDEKFSDGTLNLDKTLHNCVGIILTEYDEFNNCMLKNNIKEGTMTVREFANAVAERMNLFNCSYDEAIVWAIRAKFMSMNPKYIKLRRPTSARYKNNKNLIMRPAGFDKPGMTYKELDNHLKIFFDNSNSSPSHEEKEMCEVC